MQSTSSGTTASAAAITGQFVLALGTLTALGSLSIHMIIPALPPIAAHLRVEQASVQLTIALYLLAIGAGQLGWGPIADHFGRRPTMLGSLCLFCLGSGFAAVAPSLGWLLAGRVLQAFGSSGTLVTSRAMIADLSEPGKAVSGLATLAAITLISPAIAPGIGGAIVEIGGWRAIFWLLSIAGLVLLAGTWLRFPETRHVSVSVRPMRYYRQLLSDSRFMAITLGAAIWTATMYHYLAASPFVLRSSYHLSPGSSGLVYFGISSFMIAGTLLVRQLRRDAAVMLRLAVAVMTVAIALLACAALGFLSGLLALIVPMGACALACGICVPCAVALAQESASDAIATASSLFGALQMFIAALVASTVSHLFDTGSALPLSLAILGATGCICFLYALPRSTRREL